MAITTARERDPYSVINMTPLIDVMLVLLIIFIITIPIQTHAIKVDNPSGNPTSARAQVIELVVDFDGTLLWNSTPVNRSILRSLIVQEAAKAEQPEIHISVDKFSKYEIVAQTLADLQNGGLKKIGFVNSDFL